MLATREKIKPLRMLAEQLAACRNGHRVVHCHGVFDLLHIGHIRHLEQARKLGDLLVVTVTPDRYVNKGPGRPAFNEQLRAEALAALDCVDYVAVNEWPQACETIRALRPNIFVKGREYRDADRDHTRGIIVERQAADQVGARLEFTDDITFSSSQLINRHLAVLPETTRDYLARFANTIGVERIVECLTAARTLRVLVVGDTIIDEYHYCEAIGKSSKEPILAVKTLSSERFAGGILAVANHVAAFSEKVSLSTVIGETPSDQALVNDALKPNIDRQIQRRPDAPTIVKRRYIDHYFFQKLFEVYDMNDAPFTGPAHDACCAWLAENAASFDLVVAVDFGHGTITPKMIELLCAKAKFLAVNAQSNAGNIGYHTISKYPRADFVCIAENEIRLETRDRHGEIKPMMQQVAAKLNASQMIVTRGSGGCLGLDAERGFVEAPSLTANVKDRMGAGDTFMAVAALCAAQRAPLELTAFVGNAAGAEAVATVGHRRFIEAVPLIRHIECLLK